MKEESYLNHMENFLVLEIITQLTHEVVSGRHFKSYADTLNTSWVAEFQNVCKIDYKANCKAYWK